MPKDILFLLPPGFEDNDRREFCPECAEMWGVLSYYPAIKDGLEIRHVGIAHPRGPIVDMLGEGRHNAPTLVLAKGAETNPDLPPEEANGHRYYDRARLIAQHFAYLYGTAVPRGS